MSNKPIHTSLFLRVYWIGPKKEGVLQDEGKEREERNGDDDDDDDEEASIIWLSEFIRTTLVTQ